MNVVVVIQGREAIPVRAIPFLTNWETMSPDVVATALAGEDFMSKFKHLRAYRLEFGAVKSIDQRYWGNFISQNLSGLSAKLRLDHPQHEIGYPTWQSDSWKLLPAGAFVWKDEWEVEYHRRYGLGKYIRMTESGGVMQEEEHERSIALDFDPFIDDTRNQCIVMAGFDFQSDVPYQELHSRPTTPNPAPVAAQSALGGVSWTLKKPQRFQGYSKPLYDLLKAAHIAGQPCPKARDVLDKWKENPPPDVATVTDNGLKYYDAKGNTKPADLEAIRKAIDRMVQ